MKKGRPQSPLPGVHVQTVITIQGPLPVAVHIAEKVALVIGTVENEGKSHDHGNGKKQQQSVIPGVDQVFQDVSGPF